MPAVVPHGGGQTKHKSSIINHTVTVAGPLIAKAVLTVPLTKVLNHFSYVHTQIVLDTQTDRQNLTHFLVFPFF